MCVFKLPLKHFKDTFKFSKQLFLKNPSNGIEMKAFFINIVM